MLGLVDFVETVLQGNVLSWRHEERETSAQLLCMSVKWLFVGSSMCVCVCVCVFIAALVGAISPARRHTRALAMAVHCWRVAASQTRTWNLSSFILQVSCSSLYDAFTLLAGHREGYPACKSCDEVLVWLSAWREVQIVCIWSS